MPLTIFVLRSPLTILNIWKETHGFAKYQWWSTGMNDYCTVFRRCPFSVDMYRIFFQTFQSSLKTEERTARKRKKNENPGNSEPGYSSSLFSFSFWYSVISHFLLFVSGRKTTSWEIYNILLRKLVDQLIELGASKKINIVTFQLWASYLRLLGVAFVSKEKRQLPALSLGFRNKLVEIYNLKYCFCFLNQLDNLKNFRDVKTLYGIKNLRKKLLTSKRKRSEIDLDSSTESSNATESEMVI